MIKNKIYLIECINEYDTYYKIGITKNSVKSRLKQLQTGNSSHLKIVYIYETKFGTKLETSLHNYFNHKKIKNEWFKLDIEDVVNFKKICENIENNFQLLLDNNNYYIEKKFKK